jgi:hypothetical protein
MKRWTELARLGAGILIGVISAISFAQTPLTFRFLCQSFGIGPQEALGDREGHNLSVTNYSCRVEGGPLEGGLVTGNTIYEWDKINGTGLAGNGVVRKPGATAVFQLADFKNTLTMADSKVTGFLATGHGTYKLATGSASSLVGKTFSYTSRPNGPGQFVVDIRVE